jgi:hypothetical protein
MQSPLYVHPNEAGVAWMASPEGHPFWDVLLEKMAWELECGIPKTPSSIVSTTGTKAFQKAMNYWNQGKAAQVFRDPAWTEKEMGRIFKDASIARHTREIFYPYYHKEHRADKFTPEMYPRAWAAHHWGGSWIGK